MSTAFHGSDLEKIEQVFGIKKEDIVNFAANVNPYGFSKKAAEVLKEKLSVISTYPDPAYTELKKAISSYTGANPENIILGNGVTELLTLFLNVFSPKKAVVIGPTYSEYEKDLKRIGAEVVYIDAKEENDFVLSSDDIIAETPEDTDLVILCNPNNPTSGTLRKNAIEELAKAYQEKQIHLMIDETYVEFSKEAKDITACELTNHFSNIHVLRGTSKFFATPGLRLGYALTKNDLVLEKVSKVQDPWNINSVAELVGTVMFTDEEYITFVRNSMDEEKEFVLNELKKIPGMKTYPVFGNIVLVRLPEIGPDSESLFVDLIKKGMMIRDCSSFKQLGNRFIRICFMAHEDNVRLVEAIKESY